MQNFEDQLLVQQVADSKDHAAFAVLYSRYQKKIHDFLLFKLARKEDIDDITACVQQIPESYREIIALRFFEELEINEIAEITGKTIGNTNVLIHRGVQSLRKIMLPKMEQYDNQGI